MFKKIISILLLISLYLLICNKIYLEFTHVEKSIPVKHKVKENITEQTTNTLNTSFQQPIQYKPKPDTSIGTLIIEKINLNKNIYPIKSKENNIDQNITILEHSEEPSIENSIMFIAAHSGTGKLAFFKNLDKLKTNDIIELTYKNKKYLYKVKDIWEIKKTGTINVEKENKTQLILTTCSPTNDENQLIINSIQIKKES